MMKRRTFFLMCLMAGIGAACGGEPSAPVIQPIEAPLGQTATPFLPLAATTIDPGSLPTLAEAQLAGPAGETLPAPAQAETGPAYPDTPEGVVQSFLLASQTDPARLAVFLSPVLRDQLAGGDPMALLQFEAPVEGYAVQSGSLAMGDSPSAVVEVGLQIGGSLTRRVFSLGRQGDHWVIQGIEIQ